jgi:hypothetical protein
VRSRPGESTTRVDRSRGSAQSRLLTWEPPFRDPKNISAGRSLWHDANLVASGLAKAPTIRSHCSDCHAQDGRGLKYFNFSNASIIAGRSFTGFPRCRVGRLQATFVLFRLPIQGRETDSTSRTRRILASPSNTCAGPTMGAYAATKLQMVPVPQMRPPKTPQAWTARPPWK